MKKLFKWPGGKSSEIKQITALMPTSYDRIVEPFAGSAALSFHLERPAIINDLDAQVMNFYACLQKDWQQLHSLIEQDRKCPYMLNSDPARDTTRSLEDAYYAARTRLNSAKSLSLSSLDFQSASDFYVTRALSFSGMIRNSPKGGSNVPYGWYKDFKNSLNVNVSNLISSWTILNGSYSAVSAHLTDGDFVFLDPPYRSRAGYQTPDWNDVDHQNFIDWTKSLKCKWMIVHTDDDLYRAEFASYKIITKSHMYSQNFMGRNNSGSKVDHIYILNY
jgi:DNA adenine methylase